jgi:two-component system, OmpR family, response regulator VicR
MKILLVEDDRAVLDWLETSLSERGFEVHVAHDGDEGFATWKIRRPYDLVITDYRYPGKTIRNGLELITAIRAIDPLQAFVIQTAESKLTPPLGVPLLRKPYRFHRLLKLIKTPVHPSLPLSEQQS